MKLYHVTRINAFYQTLSQCKAPVYLTARDGSKVIWHEFRNLVTPTITPTLSEVEVTTTCSEDLTRLLRFSMEAATQRGV